MADCFRTPIRCEQVFLATAERIDLLIDLRDANVGDVLRMDTLAFEPMYAKVAEVAASDHAGMGATGEPKSGSAHEYAAALARGQPADASRIACPQAGGL